LSLTFEEWNPTQDADASQPPVAMFINSLELRAAGFTLREVILPALEAAARGGRRRYGAGLRQLQGRVLRGLYCLQTATMNSGHTASESVKNQIFVNLKITILHKIEKFFFLGKKSPFPNVCLQWCWITRTVHIA